MVTEPALSIGTLACSRMGAIASDASEHSSPITMCGLNWSRMRLAVFVACSGLHAESSYWTTSLCPLTPPLRCSSASSMPSLSITPKYEPCPEIGMSTPVRMSCAAAEKAKPASAATAGNDFIGLMVPPLAKLYRTRALPVKSSTGQISIIDPLLHRPAMRLDIRDAPLAIVDLETTGTRPASDRITEIAILEVNGLELVSRWSTLVNPGSSIPSPIQALTGITNELVAAAPKFGELAEALYEKLAGRIFVAHNARFDYGFLRREFERAGFGFSARTLCSVRLSRRLYRSEKRHDLDSVIARHGLACTARHRALGDADALWQFLKVAAAEHGAEVMSVAALQISKQPSLPAHIERAMIDEIPEAPGVYQFYGENGALLYVGKSRSLRTRVLSHFSSDLRSERGMELVQALRRIEWQRTAGELGALLREAKLVKELGPAFNRQLRKTGSACGFVFDG